MYRSFQAWPHQHQGGALIGIAGGIGTQGPAQQALITAGAGGQHLHTAEVVDIDDGNVDPEFGRGITTELLSPGWPQNNGLVIGRCGAGDVVDQRAWSPARR